MASSDLNPYAPPTASLAPTASEYTDGVWRDGRLIVVRKGSVMPDRCVKCNAPADGRRKRQTYYWHTPWLYILLISPIIFIIVTVIVRQSIAIQLGLCPEHRARRTRNLVIAWLLLFGGIGLMTVGASLLADRQFRAWSMPAILAGIGVAIAAPIFGITRARLLWPKRMDSYFAWMSGASLDYLDELPDLPPPSAVTPFDPRR